MEDTQPQILNTLMEKLIAEKNSANELQKRKHEDWNDNYELYRNKVKTNRLTQRQAVNIPLMKETIKTLLSKIDDAPNVEWKEMGGNEDKEIVYQEIWNTNYKESKLELVDILDKKNVLLYGLGTKKLNIGKNGIDIDALDIYDVVFDPLMLSGQVETARFIIHQNIFKTIREILADKRYAEKGKSDLRTWLHSDPGINQSQENREQWERKMERMKDMGVRSSDFPLFAGGDRLVNLTEHYTNVWNVKKQAFERRVVVYVDNQIELLNETLESLIGVNFYPFVVWSEDPETNDVYPDSVADLVRTPNKILNVWFSQLIENRTLKNFQMHWFLPGQNYTPQTYNPGPGVMLPAPPGDDINKVIKPVEISGLEDTLTAINTLTAIVERGTGTVAIDKGQTEKGVQTLGEVEILVGKSMERAVGMAKFYKMAWDETAVKWNALMQANQSIIISLYKKGRSGKMYAKKALQSDWKGEYVPILASSSEQETESIKSIQKFMFLIQQFPDNIELRKIAQKRMLETVDFTPDELRAVVEFETSKSEQGGIPSPIQQQQVQQPQVRPSQLNLGTV